MTLPHMTICDCVTERTGKPHVTIPRAQHEALMAAAEEVAAIAEMKEQEISYLNNPFKILYRCGQAAAALHAAGIETEG